MISLTQIIRDQEEDTALTRYVAKIIRWSIQDHQDSSPEIGNEILLRVHQSSGTHPRVLADILAREDNK